MSRVIFADGARSIGGTKLLIEDGKVRLVFDFGTNYPAEGDYFAYDKRVKQYDNVFEARFWQMRELRLLPDLPPGDAAYFSGFVETEAMYDELLDPGIDAIFLTHAHHDHMGNIPFLSCKIPLYGTPETLCFYRQKSINSYKGKKHGNLVNRYANNEHWREEKAGLKPLSEKRPVTFRRKTKVWNIRVDHSIPGACGFLVETSDGKRIAISGDFRLHGTNERRKLSESFIKTVRKKGPVDLLVVEGTNIDEYSSEREEARRGWSVKQYIKTEVELALRRGGMVIVGVSGNNIERIDSIYEVVCELDAKLHMSVYNAAVLDRLSKTGAFKSRSHVTNRLLDREHVVIYERYEREFFKKFAGHDNKPHVRRPLESYGEGDRAPQERAVMLLYDGDLPHLTRIRPREGSKYIHSSWEPFNDEQLVDARRARNWLRRYGLSHHQIHSSGHVFGAQLKQAIVDMRPKRIAPIHTLRQELFADVMPGDGVVMVKNGDVVEV